MPSCIQVHQQSTKAGSSGSGPRAKKSTAAGGGAQFVGLELYKRLKDFLKNYLLTLMKVSTASKPSVIILFWSLSSCFTMANCFFGGQNG